MPLSFFYQHIQQGFMFKHIQRGDPKGTKTFHLKGSTTFNLQLAEAAAIKRNIEGNRRVNQLSWKKDDFS